MSREDFSKRVLEQQIFDELKDTSIKSSEYFRKKYNGADIDYTRLYRRIVNYQIQEYGCTLNSGGFVYKRNGEELKRVHQRARNRRYQRRNNGRFNKEI